MPFFGESNQSIAICHSTTKPRILLGELLLVWHPSGNCETPKKKTSTTLPPIIMVQWKLGLSNNSVNFIWGSFPLTEPWIMEERVMLPMSEKESRNLHSILSFKDYVVFISSAAKESIFDLLYCKTGSWLRATTWHVHKAGYEHPYVPFTRPHQKTLFLRVLFHGRGRRRTAMTCPSFFLQLQKCLCEKLTNPSKKKTTAMT